VIFPPKYLISSKWKKEIKKFMILSETVQNDLLVNLILIIEDKKIFFLNSVKKEFGLKKAS